MSDKTQLDNHKEYGIHLREVHDNYYCGVCRNEFSSKNDFEDHVKNNHGVNPVNP